MKGYHDLGCPIGSSVLQYDFLILSLLFWIPGLGAYLARPDLRLAIRRSALCSLPFAFTEFLFYTDYWTPTFLFDLGNLLGFGIEDFLFVSAVAAGAVSIYPVLASRTYASQEAHLSTWFPIKRIASVFAAVLVLVVLARLLSVPMIYGCIAIMVLLSSGIMVVRCDLILPGLTSGLGVAVCYWILAKIYAWLYPGIFVATWHTQGLINVFLFGVPVEELLYGAATGVCAVVVYAYAFGQRFVPLNDMRKHL
jgi:hypothetical protein